MFIREEKGSALLYTMMVLIVATAFILTIQLTGRNNINTSWNQEVAEVALNIAESGLETAMRMIMNNGNSNNLTNENEISFGGGKFFISADNPSPKIYEITSRGTFRGVTRQVQSTVQMEQNLGNFGLQTWGKLNLNGNVAGSFWADDGITANIGPPPGGSTLVLSTPKDAIDISWTPANTILKPKAPAQPAITYDFGVARAKGDTRWIDKDNFSESNMDFDTQGIKNKIVFIDGDVNLSGNFTGSVTIVATGKITLNGTVTYKSDMEFNLIAGGDLTISAWINGNGNDVKGLWYSEKNFTMNGNIANGDFSGKIVSQGNATFNGTIQNNDFQPDIIGLNSPLIATVTGWQEIMPSYKNN